MAAELHHFEPEYAVPPGETLLEVLESIGMPLADLARRTGWSLRTVNEVAQGTVSITPAIAFQLELALGLPASFWINRETRFQAARARRTEAVGSLTPTC